MRAALRIGLIALATTGVVPGTERRRAMRRVAERGRRARRDARREDPRRGERQAGRARVTVQTTFAGVAPVQTGTTNSQRGASTVRELPAPPHVCSAYLYTVPSESMAPTLRVGDTTLVDHAAYRRAKPAVGNIVLFDPPVGAEHVHHSARRPRTDQARAIETPRTFETTFIKRIVAGPRDRRSVRDGRVLRKGKRAAERFIDPCDSGERGRDFPRTSTVAAGRHYVRGDARGTSDDSCCRVSVAAGPIVGRVGRAFPREADRAR